MTESSKLAQPTEDRVERSEWTRPEVRQIAAGTAEAGGVSLTNDGATFS